MEVIFKFNDAEKSDIKALINSHHSNIPKICKKANVTRRALTWMFLSKREAKCRYEVLKAILEVCIGFETSSKAVNCEDLSEMMGLVGQVIKE